MEHQDHPTGNIAQPALDRVSQSVEHEIHRVEVYTKRQPLLALAIAAACGYVLRSLPVMALIGLFLRLAMVLVRPLIFILGAVNIYDFINSRNRDNRH